MDLFKKLHVRTGSLSWAVKNVFVPIRASNFQFIKSVRSKPGKFLVGYIFIYNSINYKVYSTTNSLEACKWQFLKLAGWPFYCLFAYTPDSRKLAEFRTKELSCYLFICSCRYMVIIPMLSDSMCFIIGDIWLHLLSTNNSKEITYIHRNPVTKHVILRRFQIFHCFFLTTVKHSEWN